MKKILIIAVIVLTLVSCSGHYGQCNINYTVVYPDTTITYDSIFNYYCSSCNTTERRNRNIPITSSWRGTNYILLGDNEFVRTTCSIRINSYKTIYKEN